MGPGQDLDAARVLPVEVGGHRPLDQILWIEGRVRIGGSQLLARIGPAPPSEGRTALSEMIEVAHCLEDVRHRIPGQR